MIENIKLEFFKIRHRKVFLSVISIIILEFLWVLWSQRYKHSNDSLQLWLGLFYNVVTMNCIIMPFLTAIVASKIVDIEHKGNTLKLLKTIENCNNLFNSKFICGILIIILSLCLQSVFILLCGLICRYKVFPINYYLYYIGYTLLISITLLLLQIILSFHFINQMIPFFVAITGSFLGLFSLFFGGMPSKFVLWGYYGKMSKIIIDWNRNTRIVKYHFGSLPISDFCTVFIVLSLLYILGLNLFKLKEE